DAATGMETAFFVANPGLFSGTFSVTTSSQLWGAEANTFWPWVGVNHILVGGLLGFRYLHLDETLQFDQSSTILGNGVGFFNGVAIRAPDNLALVDFFHTRNDFYGGQIGAEASVRFGRAAINVLGKLALGTVREEAHVEGSTTLSGPLVTTT